MLPQRARGNLLEWVHAPDSPRIRQQVAFSFGVLDKIHVLLRKHRIPLVVTTLPNKAQLVSIDHASRWTLAPIEQLQAFCQNRGIPFYSPVHELETALRAGTPVYFSDNMHLDNAGQEQWADGLARYLTSILPR